MPSRKQIPHDPKTLVNQSLQGLTYLNPLITFDQIKRIVSLKQVPNRVNLICGGGSGHEPSHAAFVGPGMLSAAVCGNVFASPNSQQITYGLEKLQDGQGILIVVKNYTGDVLNFGIAKERWIAHHKTENVKMVIVGDDVSVGKEQGRITGRRGLAGTVLVCKIAGALASQGAPLAHVHAIAQYVADHSATIGVGLEHCQIPGTIPNQETNDLAPDEIEIGMGIHNEPGYKRQKLSDLKTLISDIMPILTSTTDKDRSYLPFENSNNSSQKKDSNNAVILLVNNLGSISELELGAIVQATGSWLSEKGFQVERAIAGTFMTSLNMPGFSISLVLLPPKNSDVDLPLEGGSSYTINSNLIVDLFDAPVSCAGWKTTFSAQPDVNSLKDQSTKEAGTVTDSKPQQKKNEPILKVQDSALFVEALKSACQSVIKSEPEITKYDTIAGDGDCGETLKSGAEGVLDAILKGKIDGNDLVSDLLEISEVVNRDMGGTSGGLYSIFFNSLAVGISKSNTTSIVDAKGWAKALDYALNTLFKYTRARPPSRTLIDPLSSFILNLTFTPTEFEQAIQSAKESAESTMYLDALVGRASYVDKTIVKNSQVPDPGAWGIWKILEGIGQVIIS